MSQYYTIQTLDEFNTTQYQTISTNNASVQSTPISARRILITTGSQPTYIEFGTNPSAGVTKFVVPANAQMIFNFKSGNKVAVYTATQSYTSIVDLD
jgi:pyruvate/2-oxoglutarate dehydrogenase complex dihydrolipoamide dehydrogenase (E3) component